MHILIFHDQLNYILKEFYVVLQEEKTTIGISPVFKKL